MIKIMDRYILKGFLTPFIYCFSAFVLIFVVGDLFENLDDFISQKVPILPIVQYYLFMVPSIFVLTTPLAVLLSILYQLGYMSRYNELTALKSSGIHFLRIAMSFFVMGIIITVALIFMNEFIIPRCYKQIDVIKESYSKKSKQSAKDVINVKEGKNITFFSSVSNLSVYMDRMVNENAQGMSIREYFDDGSLKREWYAKNAQWVDANWWLFDGYVRRYSSPGAVNADVDFFAKQEIVFSVSPEELLQSQKNYEDVSNYMNSRELYMYLKRNFTQTNVPKGLVVDLYRKLSGPFTVIIVTIFGVTFGAKISRGGALISVGYSLMFYMSYYGISSLLLAMGKMGRLFPIIAVWSPNAIFGIISIFLLRKVR